MRIDEDNISNKSPMLTLLLCLILGRFGVHRFYVGKYVSGILFLLVGSVSFALDTLDIGYAFLLSILFTFLMIIDIYALYSESFTDAKGRILTDSNVLIYKDLKERETILFDNKLNKILITVAGIIAYVIYLIIVNVLI